jgi:predicted transcriptional regulator of viral defense system
MVVPRASIVTPTNASSVALVVGKDTGGIYEHVYAAATATGISAIALIGLETGTIRRSTLSDCTLSNQACTGSSKTTVALQTPSTYLSESPAWDIRTTWGFRKSAEERPTGYPCLRWEAGCGGAGQSHVRHAHR